MSNDQEKREQEIDSGAHPVNVPAIKQGRRALGNVRRELSEKELSSPGARRLLLDNVDRLEDEVATLRQVEENFHDVDKRAAILEEKLKASVAVDVMFGVALSVGFGLIGIVSNIWDKKPYNIIIVILASVLIVGGIAVKVLKR